MVSAGALTIAGACAIILLATGLWAEFRFRRFDNLPAHFDFAGRPTSYASRRFMIWLTPLIFMGMIALIVWLVGAVPPEQLNGDPDDAVILASIIIVATQFFILWLLVRWARGQAS